MVQTITRGDTNPTSATSTHFIVTFSEAVTGVDINDFALTGTGVTGAVITTVSGSGTIGLDVVDNDTIMDLALNFLGGVGAGNGSFSSGEMYAVRFYCTWLPLILKN